jgi:peptidoglycan hydrolase CwlO-like protein
MDNGEIVDRCMLCDIKIEELKNKIKEIESRNLPSDEELESLKEDLEVLENN